MFDKNRSCLLSVNRIIITTKLNNIWNSSETLVLTQILLCNTISKLVGQIPKTKYFTCNAAYMKIQVKCCWEAGNLKFPPYKVKNQSFSACYFGFASLKFPSNQIKVGNMTTRTRFVCLKNIGTVDLIWLINIGFKDDVRFALSALGLKYIHLLTANNDAILRIDLKAYEAPDGKNDTAYAIYGKFWIGNRLDSYYLEEMSDYTGKMSNNTIESV